MKEINNEKVLKEIKKSPLLSAGFKWFVRYNTGITNPYHNLNHTLRLMQLILEYLESDEVEKENVSKEKILLLALFHDFGHSAGKFGDEVNVEIAVRNLKNFLYTQGGVVSLYDIEALEDTIYPYSSAETKTIEGKVLRNFDCLQWIFSDFITQCVYGLKTEGNYQGDGATEYMNFVTSTLIPQLTISFAISLAEKYKDEFCESCKLISNIR